MITGKLKESKAEVTKKISSMGGLVVTKCDKAVAAVISSKGIIMPPTLKKLMGHIAFGACVHGCVGHTFCTYCNF